MLSSHTNTHTYSINQPITLEPPLPSSEAMKVGNSMATLEPAAEDDDEEDCTVALFERTNQQTRVTHEKALHENLSKP